MLDEQAALDIVIGGRYAGMKGLTAFENDLSRMSGMAHKTFVEPFSGKAGVAGANERAMLARNSALMASAEAEQKAQKSMAGRLQVGSQYAQSIEREKKALTDVEQARLAAAKADARYAEVHNRALSDIQRAQLSANKADERYTQARNRALSAPTGSHKSQYAVQTAAAERQIAQQRLADAKAAEVSATSTRSAEKQLAEGRLANAQTTAKAYAQQRVAVSSSMASQVAAMDNARVRAEANAKKMQQIADDEAKNARNVQRQYRVHQWTGPTNALANVGIMGSAGVLGGLGLSAQAFIKWQQSVGSMGANTNMSAAEERWLVKNGPKLLTQMPANTDQILGAYRFARQANFSYGNALTLSKDVLKSALPTGADPSSVMFTLTALLKQYGYSGSNAVKNAKPILDMLHTAAAEGQMSVGQFANVFGQVGGMASMAKSPEIMTESMAMLSAMTQMHIPYAQASTQVRGFLQQILAPRPQTLKTLQGMYDATGGKVNLISDFSAAGLRKRGIGGILQDIGNAHLSPEIMRQIFPNMRGMLAANLLTTQEGQGVYNRINRQVHQAPQMGGVGATQYEYNQWMKTAGPQFKQIQSDLRATEIALGQGLLPLMVQFTKQAVPVAQSVAKWAEAHKSLAPLIGKVAFAVLGASLAVRGFNLVLGPMVNLLSSPAGRFFGRGLITGFKGLASGMMMVIRFAPMMGAAMYTALGPIGLIIAGGVLLAAGLVILYNKWKPFHDLVNNTAQAIKNFVTGSWNDLTTWLAQLGDWFGKLPGEWLKFGTDAAMGFIHGIENTASRAWNAAKNWLHNIIAHLGFHSPNEYGVDFSVFGRNAGNDWSNGLVSTGPGANSKAKKLVQGVTVSITDANGKHHMYQAGQSLGQQVASGIQSKLNHMTFAASVSLSGTNAQVANVINTGSQRIVKSGGIITVPGWPAGTAASPSRGAPGQYYSPGLHKWLPTPFGNYAPASANYVSNSPSNDLGMLQSWHIPTYGTIMDTDYPTGYGKKNDVMLPGSSKNKWKLLKKGVDKNTGGYEVWQAPNGGIVTFLHMSKEEVYGPHSVQVAGPHGTDRTTTQTGWYNPSVGSSISGGTVVGLSGHPLTSKYGNNPNFWHLCVVTDARGRQYITYLTNGQMQQVQKSGGKVKVLPKTGGNSQNSNAYNDQTNLSSPYVSSWERKNWKQLEGVSQQTGISMPQLLTLLSKESTGGTDPRAGNNIMQVEPGTFAQMGVKNNGSRGASLTAGSEYFMYLLNGPAHGNVQLAFQMYNGSGPMARAYGGDAYKRYQNLSFGAGNPGAQQNYNPPPSHPNVPSGHKWPWEKDPNWTPGPKTPPAVAQKYWEFKTKNDKMLFQSNFQGVSWKWLNPQQTKLYESEQEKIWRDQERSYEASVKIWWQKLTPAQRRNPAYQQLYTQRQNLVSHAYDNNVKRMQGSFAAQPYIQNAFWMHSGYENLRNEWGLVQRPWDLNKSQQRQWLKGEKSMDWYWAQWQAAQARAYAKQHADQKGIVKWLADRLHGIWAAQSQKDANALYKLTHHGADRGALGRVQAVHIVGHCAAESAANVHRKKSGDGAEKTAENTKALKLGNDKLVKGVGSMEDKLDKIHSAIVSLRAEGGIHTPHPPKPNPNLRGIQRRPSTH